MYLFEAIFTVFLSFFLIHILLFRLWFALGAPLAMLWPLQWKTVSVYNPRLVYYLISEPTACKVNYTHVPLARRCFGSYWHCAVPTLTRREEALFLAIKIDIYDSAGHIVYCRPKWKGNELFIMSQMKILMIKSFSLYIASFAGFCLCYKEI